MKIGIIGAGRVGGTLGKIFAQKGHEICFGVRNPQSEKIQSLLVSMPPQVKADTVKNSAAADILVLATPWEGTQDAIVQAGELEGKIIIDTTNPIEMTPEGLAAGLIVGHNISGAEMIAQWATNAKVVKVFNNIGASQYENPTFNSTAATAFICGDDIQAKEVVKILAEDIGFAVVDAGPLKIARLLEPLGLLWINLAFFQGLGQDFAINLVKR